MIIERHIVSAVPKNTRIYDYLPGKLEVINTRKGIKKALRKGCILRNGSPAKSGDYIQENDLIALIEQNENPPKVYQLTIPVIYEDEHMAIVSKPPGLRTSGNVFKTLHNSLPFNLSKSKEVDALPWPLPIHRLDQLTSGLMIIAKTYSSRVKLGQLLENHTILKTYHALVQGSLHCSGILNTPIDGKEASTHFKTLQILPCRKNGFLSLLLLQPQTGRKHQLRIHLSRLGFPILGDKIHGNPTDTLLHKGLFLCATQLTFPHPITNEIGTYKIDLPYKFQKRLKQ